MADRGDDLFLFGDDFEAILDILDEDEVLQEQFSTAASEVSAKYVKNLHVLGLFEGIYGATRDCTVTRANNSKQRISRRFQMIIPKLYSRKFIKLYLVYLAEVP